MSVKINKNKTKKIQNITSNEKEIICGTNIIIYKSFQQKYTQKQLIQLKKDNNDYYKSFVTFLNTKPKTKPTDDYYSYVNDNWINSVKLKNEDNSKYDSFNIIQVKVFNELIGIYNNIGESSSTSKEIINMKEFYESAIRSTSIQKSTEYIHKYIDTITKLTNEPIKNNLWKVLAITSKNKMVSTNGSPISFDIKPNEKNSKTYAVYLEPIKLSLDLGLFINTGENIELKKEILHKYKQHWTKIINVIFGNNNKLKISADDIIEVQTEIIECFYSNEIDTSEFNYNKIDLTTSVNKYSFNFEEFVKELGFTEIPNFFITPNLNYFKKVTELMLKKWNTPKWRNYWIILYIDQIVGFTEKWKEINNDFYLLYVNGQAKDFSPEIRAMRLLLIPYNNLFSKMYIEKYKDEYSINYIKNMTYDLKHVLYKQILNNTWMDHKTKKVALLKLNNLKVVVGVQTIEIEDPDLNFLNNDIWGNMIRMLEWKLSELIRLINNPVSLVYLIDYTSRPFKFAESQVFNVNANYNRSTNTIYVPLAFIQKPFIDLEESGIEYNLANIGFVIAHELLHSLDISGSMYDSNGNLYNWWSSNDKIRYLKIQDNIKNQYMYFAKKDNLPINTSDISISENFADVNSIYLCTEYLKDFLVHQQIPYIQQREIFENFFLYYANQMKEKNKEKFLKFRIFNNPHALDKYRVNVPLSRIDVFKAMYNITKKDGMYWENSLSFFK